MKRQSRFFILLLLILAIQQDCFAQPFSLDDHIAPTELMLVPYNPQDSAKRGKINMTNVTQNKDTSYYFIKGFSMFSPTYFGLTTKAGSGNVHVNLCKNNWKQFDRSGETGDKNYWEANFKTEGDFGIMVIADAKPVEYTMVTWTGDEAKDVGITSPFKDGAGGSTEATKTADTKKKGNFFKDNLVYILGLLVVVLGIALFIKMKKK